MKAECQAFHPPFSSINLHESLWDSRRLKASTFPFFGAEVGIKMAKKTRKPDVQKNENSFTHIIKISDACVARGKSALNSSGVGNLKLCPISILQL